MTWDISNGTRWVVVFLQDDKTTTQFFDDQNAAESCYACANREDASNVLFARVMKVRKNK